MKASKSGWGPRELDRLYLGFGFVRVEGAKHCLYKHPAYPDLRVTVSRANSLAVGYIQTAVKMCEKARDRDRQRVER